MQKLAAKNQVIKVIADQCAFNLRGAHGLHRKSTGILTNNSVIAQAVNKRCSKDHIHEVIIGGDKSAKSQVYPRELIPTILEAYKKPLSLEEIYYTTWETIDLENDKIDQIYAEYWTEVDQIGGATERECHPVDELPELLEEPVQPFRDSDMEAGGSLHAENPEQGESILPEGSEQQTPANHGRKLPLQDRFTLRGLLHRAHGPWPPSPRQISSNPEVRKCQSSGD